MGRAPPVVRELRGVLYALLSVLAGVLLSLAFALAYVAVKPFDPDLALFHGAVLWCSRRIISLFGIEPIVRGRENLVGGGGAAGGSGAIIVSNHQSDLDSNLLSFAARGVNFKCVFKKELFYFPGVGSTMYLEGYMPVDRGNKASGKNMMERARAYLARGAWVLFFPEGTRKIDGSTGNMGAFKPGAFLLSLASRAPLQPISISGSRDLMSAFGTLPALHFATPGSPVITIHAPIYPTPDDTVESLMAKARAVIGSALRECDDVAPPRGRAGAGGAAATSSPSAQAAVASATAAAAATASSASTKEA
jgi:1-acyl-sn-glycerol-3-phosphate acyltransferase